MAGSKESPRQKMIGMMYLVLTALLALQVSSALLYKFEALNSNIEKKVTKASGENETKKTQLEREVKKRGNKPREVKLASDAQEIAKNTQEVLSYIDGIKKDLIQETGGYNSDGALKGANEETPIEVYMIGASESSGKAYELKKKLDAYTAFMTKKTGATYSPLALDAKDDPKLKNNSDQKNKNFAQLNFGQTPLVAALAVLSEIESRVVDMETQSLTAIYDSIGIDNFDVDRMMPFVRPKSDFVVAGTKYEAEVCMVATSSSLKPSMEVGSQALEVDANGVGKYSFMAQGGGAYNEKGFMKKTWVGKIKTKKPNGEDTVYTVTQEYNVVKPTIQIQSAAIRGLYRNCGNKISIQVPALGADYQPNFEIEGGTLTALPGTGNVMIVPTTGSSVTVRVRNRGLLIGEERFGVKLVPLPQVELYNGVKKINPIVGCTKGELRSIRINLIADQGIREQLPEETTYYPSEGRVVLVRRKSGIKEIPITGSGIDLTPFANDMQPNDRIIVEIKKIKRKNYKGGVEEINFSKTEVVPIN